MIPERTIPDIDDYVQVVRTPWKGQLLAITDDGRGCVLLKGWTKAAMFKMGDLERLKRKP